MPPSPPSLGLGLGLQFTRHGPALDPDAAAYIAALVSGGATVSSVQSGAIDTFIRAEKAGSRWDSLKRMYLPIWGLAAANAICMKTLTSGTFVGGVTHGAGFVQGNGSTGYFDMGITPAALGLTLSSSSLGFLSTQAPSGTGFALAISSVDASDTARVMDIGSSNVGSIRFTANSTAVNLDAVIARASQTGIFIGSRTTGNRSIYRRTGSGYSVAASASGADLGTVPNAKNLTAMRSQFSTGGSYSDGRYSEFHVAMGFSYSQSSDFSLNLKNLWETCTGLALPA